MNCLGSIGRLGNQMFQYAALRGIAKKFNYEYCLPVVAEKMFNEDLNLFECFYLNSEKRQNTTFSTIKSETFGFDENLFKNCPDNVDLHGYFQDIRYFQNCESEIRSSFKFQENYSNVAKEFFYSCFGNDEVLSVHIRRQDYLNFSHHPVQSIEYYDKALKFFNKNLKVVIFSDDIEWAKNQELFNTSNRFFFSQNNNVAVDLCMQTFCNYHIISNSTMSWWGAWLAQSKKVIKPSLWFGPPLDHYKNFLDVKDWMTL